MKGNAQNIFKLHIKHGTFANALLLIDLSFTYFLKRLAPYRNFFPLFFSNNSGIF